MFGRDLLAVSFLRGMPLPILGVRYEPFGGNQISDGMVIVLRLNAPKNSVGYLALDQEDSYPVTFCETFVDRSHRPVGLASDLTETTMYQFRCSILTQFGAH